MESKQQPKVQPQKPRPKRARKPNQKKPRQVRQQQSIQQSRTVVYNPQDRADQIYQTLSAPMLRKQLNIGATSWVRSLLNPQGFAARVPDSVQVPTALYVSRQNFTVIADMVKDNGRFTAIMQPILGQNGSSPQFFQNAIWDSDSTANFDNSAAFLSFSGRSGLRVDQNAQYLTSPGIDQNTYLGYISTNNLGTSEPWFNKPRIQQGSNNRGYKATTSGSSQITGKAIQNGGEWLIPDGTHFHTIQLDPTSIADDQSQTFYDFSSNICHQYESNTGEYPPTLTNVDTQISVLLRAYNKATQTTITVASFTVTVSPRNGAPNFTVDNQGTTQLEYFSGNMNSMSGAGSTNNNDYGNSIIINFFTNFANEAGNVYFLSVPCYIPIMKTVTLFQYRWHSTTSVVDNTPLGSDGLVQKMRPVAMSALFQCQLSDLNNGGTIMGALCYGNMQDSVFSASGKEFTQFDSLSQQNLPLRMNVNKLKLGSYVYWVPDSGNDIFLRTPHESNTYQAPFIIMTGEVSNQIAGKQEIGILTVTRIFEYSTCSTLIDTQAQPGTDDTWQLVTASLSTSSKAFENPKHMAATSSLLSSAWKTVNSVVNSPVTKALVPAALSLL